MCNTINDGVRVPSLFSAILYSVIFLTVAAVTGFLALRGSSPRDAVLKAFVVALFASGLLYAAHAEITWYSWVVRDVRQLASPDTETKLKGMGGAFYEFVSATRVIIQDDDYQLYSKPEYYELLTQYYLLPARKRDEAEFIVVMGDPDVEFSYPPGVLKRGDIRIGNLEVCLGYRPDACVLRRK